MINLTIVCSTSNLNSINEEVNKTDVNQQKNIEENSIDNFTSTIVDMIEDFGQSKNIKQEEEPKFQAKRNKNPENFLEYISKYGEPRFFIKIDGGLVLGWTLKSKVIFRIFNVIGICDKKMTIYKEFDHIANKDSIQNYSAPFIKMVKKYPAYKPNENIFVYSGNDKYYLINKMKAKKRVVTIENLQEAINFNKSDFQFKEKQIIINDTRTQEDKEEEKKKKSFDKKLNKILDVYGVPIFITGDCKGNELLFFVKNYPGMTQKKKFFDILIVKMNPYNKLKQVMFYNSETNTLEENNVSY